MKKIAIVGVGSPIGQDYIAALVIDNLQHQVGFNKQVAIKYYDRPGLHLLDYLQGYDIVHVIDAIVSQNEIGTIHRYEDITLFQKNALSLSTHNFGLAETLALGSVLQCLPEKLIIHTIEIDPQQQASLLTVAIKQGCDKLTQIIIDEVS